MRYQASYDAQLGETSIEITSNCYTDAYPLLRRLVFRKQDVDLTSQSLPLASAILTAQYCGEVFEFAGIRIGSDHAEAIRMIIGPDTNIANVDGHHRTISTGEVDVFCEEAGAAGRAGMPIRPDDSTSLARTDWSGDFVNPGSRSSAHHAFGAYQTNAGFFAPAMLVSAAIGLIHGRDRCRNLYVAQPVDEPVDLSRLQAALATVSVALMPVAPQRG